MVEDNAIKTALRLPVDGRSATKKAWRLPVDGNRKWNKEGMVAAGRWSIKKAW